MVDRSGIHSWVEVCTTSKELRRSLRGKQRKCAHDIRIAAVLVYADGSEHMVMRCQECKHNKMANWDTTLIGRPPYRFIQHLGELRLTKHGIPGSFPKAIPKRTHEHPFYDSPEWRCLRYKALRLHGPKCQLCGSRKEPLHVDHIKPRSIYPELELKIENLQVLCRDCNLGKSNKFEDDWRTI